MMMRMVVAESQLADRVFAVPYDEAAFTDVVKKSVNSIAQFGEGIVNGRRYAAVYVIDSAINFQPVSSSQLNALHPLMGADFQSHTSSNTLNLCPGILNPFYNMSSCVQRSSTPAPMFTAHWKSGNMRRSMQLGC